MKTKIVNNDYYNTLRESWYTALNNPIAILRVEQRAKTPWILERIKKHFINDKKIKILDIGCGAGFLTNELGRAFPNTYGLDASASTIEVAKAYDLSGNVDYILGDAYELPFEDESMDIICAMDFLEHVEDPSKVIREASRVLKKDGLFFFHTFNRNFLSWLIVIKAMEWFVPNTPSNLHVLSYFIKPKELEQAMSSQDLIALEWTGIRPKFNSAFLKSLLTSSLQDNFQFKLTPSLMLGYMGVARKHFGNFT